MELLQKVNGVNIALGNEKLMKQFSVNLSGIDNQFSELSSLGKTVIFCAVNSELAGIFAIEDPIKNSSIEAISKMKIPD